MTLLLLGLFSVPDLASPLTSTALVKVTTTESSVDLEP